jgi:hypothetical protein
LQYIEYVGIFFEHLVFSTAIWYICRYCGDFVYFPPVLVCCCDEKNLATLDRRPTFFQFSSHAKKNGDPTQIGHARADVTDRSAVAGQKNGGRGNNHQPTEPKMVIFLCSATPCSKNLTSAKMVVQTSIATRVFGRRAHGLGGYFYFTETTELK